MFRQRRSAIGLGWQLPSLAILQANGNQLQTVNDAVWQVPWGLYGRCLGGFMAGALGAASVWQVKRLGDGSSPMGHFLKSSGGPR